MPRNHARINVSLWQDDAFRSLPPAAQHLYFTLWTHPELSYCGVVDWRPGRIAALSEGWTALDVLEAAECLEARLFIVTDHESEECLIRSWAKWDGLLKENRMSVSWANAYAVVASNDVRGVIVHEARKWHKAFPEWVAWSKPAVLGVLEQPALDPATRDLPRDVFRGGLRGPLRDGLRDGLSPTQAMGLGVAQGSVTPNPMPRAKGSVKGSPTPSPAPTPLLQLQTNHLGTEPHQAPAPVASKADVPRVCSDHGHDRTPGCAHCITLSHLPAEVTA